MRIDLAPSIFSIFYPKSVSKSFLYALKGYLIEFKVRKIFQIQKKSQYGKKGKKILF